MTVAYGSLHFSTSLLTLVHSGAIPLLVVKTIGLNEEFSMFIILWLYRVTEKDAYPYFVR